jgi:G3E family GTPase
VTKNKALIEPIQTETPKSFLPIDKNGKIIVTKKRVVNVATAAGSSEAAAVVTASLTCDDPMDLHNVSLFIGKVLREKGETLYRLKGILSMQGYDRQFVAHGIHMLFDGELGPEWPTDRKRSSKLVLIGLDLDPGALQEEFLKCRVAGIAKS